LVKIILSKGFKVNNAKVLIKFYKFIDNNKNICVIGIIVTKEYGIPISYQMNIQCYENTEKK